MEINARKDDQTTSLLYNTDFCDFGDLSLPNRSHGSSSRGSSEIDSDVEETIYAHMYFEDNSTAVELPVDDGKTANSEETGAAGHVSNAADVNQLSVSLVVDSPPKSKVKKKKRRRRKKKRNGNRSEAPPPLQSAATEDGEITSDDVIVSRDDVTESSKVTESSEGEKDSQVFIDLTLSDSDRPAAGRPAQQNSKEVIIISSDSDRDINRKVTAAEDTAHRRETGDGVESEGVSSESGESCDDSEEEGEASSDMQLSDQQDDVLIFDDPWRVNLKDKLGREAYERRYGNSKGRFQSRNGFKCANCKQRNHTHRNCPWPKRHQVCYLCGRSDHLSSKCPIDLCTYCYQDKHRGRSCSTPWSSPKTQCLRCFMTGHHASICPDIWRQFHNTTYSDDQLMMVSGSEQRREDGVCCYNCAMPGHYGFECTRTLPRGWPQPHLPLIAKYDLNVWPPTNLAQLRTEHGVVAMEKEREDSRRRKRKSSSGGGPSRKRARESWGERRNGSDRDDVQSTHVKVAVGPHPSLRTRGLPHLAKMDRSMSVDAGLLTSRGPSSLLGTPSNQRTFDIHVPRSSLLSAPTTPIGHMPPPTRSLSSRSTSRADKRPFHLSLEERHHHRRDSEPIVTKRPRVSAQGDFPREPIISTPPPYHASELNERIHHHHGNHHDQPHSSGQHYDERHLSNSAHNDYHNSRHSDARALIEGRSNRRMSYNDDRGVYHEAPPLAPPPYHRRLSDYSELASGGRSGYHDKRHVTDDERMVNDRGFRGQPHLSRNIYRH